MEVRKFTQNQKIASRFRDKDWQILRKRLKIKLKFSHLGPKIQKVTKITKNLRKAIGSSLAFMTL